ncbi:MAG: hypothetical protein Q8Q15_01935 [bacterium]|nr:hypothetical protein [bacterium]
MKKILLIPFLFLFLLFSKTTVAAQIEPTPVCECTPGSVRYDCYNTIPDGWCQDETKPGNFGRGQKFICSADCRGWDAAEIDCFASCTPPKPQITPVNYSLENSVGDFNEYTEKGVHSGTRDTAIDASDPNNYGAVAALIPAGGPQDELRVKFVIERGSYDVVLGDGSTKTARDIWNGCTDNANPNNFQANREEIQKQFEVCPDWGYVPTTYRRLANEPTPVVAAKEPYFKEDESPFVMSWGVFAPLEWVVKFFQNLFCTKAGWFCPTSSLPLRNPDNAAGWTAKKPNIPKESTGNAELLRQFLLPKKMPLGALPDPKEDTYFDIQKTQEPLAETGRAAQQTSAEGGLFRIFQPQGMTLSPATCSETSLNPDQCASDYYFQLSNASTGACPGNLCHTDTPDDKTFDIMRVVDDRPLTLKTHMNFFKQSLWPFKL